MNELCTIYQIIFSKRKNINSQFLEEETQMVSKHRKMLKFINCQGNAKKLKIIIWNAKDGKD